MRRDICLMGLSVKTSANPSLLLLIWVRCYVLLHVEPMPFALLVTH